ncbi:hypothetical protein QOZ80_5BG0441850 [Eleusine coracana subsp. coracana]|nr:hypothetical protein QOZ80_5BG0441770 [Eleusine coracana subsp. coracana]KAK3136747.1 hypothetical protein QOZ80_5BG0441850 [Eleusine coracana subsp. coracana]
MAQPPPPPAGEAATYPAKEIAGIVAFLGNVAAAFESDPAARDEFFALVTGFGAGTGGADAAAVVARATEILGARPDLLAQFIACLTGPPDEGAVAAPTRPRRSNRSRPAPMMIRVAVDDPDGELDLDDERENKLRRKREREQARRAAKRAAAAALAVDEDQEDSLHRNRERKRAVEEDPRLAEAMEFVDRVKRVAGEEAHWRFLNVVYDAEANPHMDAGAVYDAVRAALGPAHVGLLHRFATLFLPGEADWAEQQARRPERKRRHDTGGGDHAQSKKKKPRTDDNAARSKALTGSSIGTVTQRARNGEGAGSSKAPADRHFRALWEFETGYSILVATMARTEEMIELHAPPSLNDEGDDDDGAYSLDLEKLYPSRDSRKFLERMYGTRWSKMRKGLEDSRFAGRALRVVMDSLRWTEERAVKDAREWRDRARAAERLNQLVVDEEQRRPQVKGGLAR